MKPRTIAHIVRPLLTSDGAGVKLQRTLGQSPEHRHDPFLLLDEFSTENPEDYIAGFPAHPHRGFETVTYMLDGHMLHEDHLGNRGDLRAGGAQWMSAGRGVIHSEMPQQKSGRMRGFQLWINLPASEKMKPAAYRDLQPEDIPAVDVAPGVAVRVIAGTYDRDGKACAGPLQGLTTQLIYFDVRLTGSASFEYPLAPELSALAYVYEGALDVPLNDTVTSVLMSHHAAILSAGDTVRAHAGGDGAGFLLLAARPLNEPVVQRGPFVMNTEEEVQQAIRDYQRGELV